MIEIVKNFTLGEFNHFNEIFGQTKTKENDNELKDLVKVNKYQTTWEVVTRFDINCQTTLNYFIHDGKVIYSLRSFCRN